MATAASRSLGPCSFCNVALGPDGFTCTRCGASMHAECYWGRVALLEEWRAYIRRVMETKDEFQADVVCVACRKGGA